MKGEASVFKDKAYINGKHELMLDEDYFPIICQIDKYPRYQNKRVLDPQIKMMIDQTGNTESLNWGLPRPNEDASYKSLAKYGKDRKSVV